MLAALGTAGEDRRAPAHLSNSPTNRESGPMDLQLTDAEIAFRDELREFLAGMPAERAPLTDEAARFRESVRWQRLLAGGGWAVPGWPKRWGGRAAGPVELMIYEQELGRVHPPRAINTIGTGWGGAALLRHGSEEQQLRYLPKIPAADEIWCQLFSEPNAGSDLASLTTRAGRIDGGYRIDGQKVWSSIAQVAGRGLLLARTDPSAAKHEGISCFVLDMHAPGVTVRPIRQITGEQDFNEVFFDGVFVPEDDRLAGEGEGWKVAITTLLAERVGLTAGEGTLWGSGPTFADVLDLWRRRRDAGRLPPGQMGATLRDEIARLHIEGQALRLTGLRLLSAVARSDPSPGSARPEVRGESPLVMMSVRKLASDVWGQQVHDAVWRLLGPEAMLSAESGRAVDGGAWQRAFLFARALTIGGGTTEVQRNILARRILGLPV
jgi:alkylation response protein AidB-like acyl-CoA dehydrogenase